MTRRSERINKGVHGPSVHELFFCSHSPRSTCIFTSFRVVAGLQAQTVLVNDTVSGFIGTDVVLHCSFTNPLPNVKITQVTWQKATNGTKQNVAIYNPAMGVSILSPYKERVTFRNPSFKDGTIQLSRLELEDEGVYICEFATFPTGNRESQLNLTVLGKRPDRLWGVNCFLQSNMPRGT